MVQRASARGDTRDAEWRGSSLADRAYYAIRDMIVSLELRPGSVISERDLTEMLQVGRTPTREALRRLAQEKLVEVYPRRGMFVTNVEMGDLVKLCEVRAVLEGFAARLAAERATDEDRAELRALLEVVDGQGGSDDRELMRFDEAVHRCIYRCGGNSFLESTLDEYFVLALRIWFLALEQPRELKEAVLEHRQVLEAIIDGKGVLAEKLMRAHVLEFETAIRRVLLGGPTADLNAPQD